MFIVYLYDNQNWIIIWNKPSDGQIFIGRFNKSWNHACILKVQRSFFLNFLIKLCLEMFECPVTDCSSRIAKIQEDYCLKKHLNSYHSLKVDKVR